MSPVKRYKKEFEANKGHMPGGYYDDIFLPLHTAEIEDTDNSRFAPHRALHKDTAPYDPTKENRDDFSPSVGMPDRSAFCSLHKGVSPRDFQLPPNAYITVKDNKNRLIFLCKEHIYSLYLCLCRVLENPYSSTDEIGDMCIIMHLPDKPYLYKYNGGGRKYTIRFSSTDSSKSLTVSEEKLVDFAQKLADNAAFCEMFPKEKEELKSLCRTSQNRISNRMLRRNLYRKMNPFYRGKFVNLGMSQKKAKEQPLTDFNVYLTYDFECLICHCEKTYIPAAIIEAGRKNDRLCFALCMDCIYDLQYVLRYVNKNRLTYSDCDGLTVVYTDSFNSGQYCYFCGEDSGHCYHITLNSIRIQLCSHCRKTVITQLRELLNEMEKNTAD